MNGDMKEVLYDIDGSFTTSDFDGIQRPSATVTANFAHMRNDAACRVTINSALWHNTVVCDENVKVTLVRFKSMTPSNDFKNVMIKVQEVSHAYEFVPEDSTSYSGTVPEEKKQIWALPFIGGRMYNVWWHTGLDFTFLEKYHSNMLT